MNKYAFYNHVTKVNQIKFGLDLEDRVTYSEINAVGHPHFYEVETFIHHHWLQDLFEKGCLIFQYNNSNRYAAISPESRKNYINSLK